MTKVFLSDRVVRFSTPKALKKAIPVFDKTGRWPLKKGETYKLYTFYEKKREKKKSGPSGKSGKRGFKGAHRAVRSRETGVVRAAGQAA